MTAALPFLIASFTSLAAFFTTGADATLSKAWAFSQDIRAGRRPPFASKIEAEQFMVGLSNVSIMDVKMGLFGFATASGFSFLSSSFLFMAAEVALN
jgi:hypothetical protein